MNGKRIVKSSWIFTLCCIASALLLCSCGNKTYNGFQVKKGAGKVDVILLPVVTDNTSYDVGLSDSKYFEYPLVCYKAMEKKVMDYASLYSSFQGISEEDYAPYNDFFKYAYYGEFDKCLESEKDRASYAAWFNASQINASEATPDQLKDVFDELSERDTFHSATRWAVNGLEDLSVRIYRFKNGKSWYESVDEIFSAYKKEREGCIPYLERIFPSVTFARKLPAEMSVQS